MIRTHHGSTRITVCILRWAFKVPNFLWGWQTLLRGLLANMNEAESADPGAPSRQAKLCMAIWSLPGGFLACFPRALALTDAEYDALASEDWFYHHCGGRRYPLPVESKADSWGWVNGRILAIDYGDLL